MDFTELIDLASERLGGAVLFANDEFFAPKENLLKPGAPVFIEGKYTDLGKWMDGWESRRKRAPDLRELYDWCIIRLGLPGLIRGVIVDTSHFRGNYPSHCSLDACAVEGHPDVGRLTGDATSWAEILPRSELQGDSRNQFAIEQASRATHLRFKIYPDGGVARLRVYGEVTPDWERLIRRNSDVDLAAVKNGGHVIGCSDMFFGHRHNLIMPGRALNMSDGWETKRRRGPGHDWAVIRLGRQGVIQRLEVDTSWFKGNFPESCSVEAVNVQGGEPEDFSALEWKPVLSRTGLQAHTRHYFEDEVINVGPATHVRFNIFPDGGVSRLRVFGRIVV
ncbi:MAG TPA: allantoicase [Blastocatellia bacterium]|nr:allantoicase [Blastocatellia bacterium]